MTNILFLIGTILMQSIQMQLSKKRKTFCQFFSAFLEFRLSFVGFEKKDHLIGYAFRKLSTAKDVVTQMSKKSCFKRPFNM